MKIDDKVVFDHSDIPRVAVAQRSIELAPGAHKIVVEVLSAPQFGTGVTRLGIAKEGTFVHPAALDLAKHADAVVIAVANQPKILNRNLATRSALTSPTPVSVPEPT
jgi:hypothetical protein